MNPGVNAVLPKDEYKLEIAFSSGEIGVFKGLRDLSYLKQAGVVGGTVVWRWKPGYKETE